MNGYLFFAIAVLMSPHIENSAHAQCQSAQPLGQALLWPDSNSFTTFGPNELIVIDIGLIAFVSDGNGPCLQDDFIFPVANIYIVEAGTVCDGSALDDAGGAPNTIFGSTGGGFVAEVIGSTGPQGSLGQGTYDVVYDECQDGVYNAGTDALFRGALVVVMPATGIPPPINPAIQQIKTNALSQAQHWAKTLRSESAFLALLLALDAVHAILSPFHDPVGYIITVIWIANHAGANFLHIHLEEIALTHLLNMVRHYSAIAADPPDPNFQQSTPLPEVLRLGSNTDDPLL